ncbi:hypothetical protein CI105_07305 [Candidatus Izimaplasma bacterium ZiA1]|nr:hypothetical protein CI105_07305 [Candidatus Izimaplasma bacterium ZiA1]
MEDGYTKENKMKKYTDFLYKMKKPLMLLIFGYTIFSLVGIFQIKLNTDFSLFSTNDSKYEDELKDLEISFGNLNQIIVLVEHEDFDDEVLNNLAIIQSKILEISNVIEVQGVAPQSIMLNGVETDISEINAETIKAYYSNFEEFSPLLIKDDIYYSIFTVFINDEFNTNNVNSVEDILAEHNYPSYISGDTYNQAKITDYIIKILLILPPLALLTILFVFRWQMKAFKPTILSVLPAAIGSIWTLGAVGWFGNEVSMLTAVVPIFIIVIGSADGLHFMSHFQDSIIDGNDYKKSTIKTLTIVGKPMIVTTLTSMVGFLSLLSMNTSSIYDLAVFSAIGILVAGIATWLVLPLILSNELNVLPKNQSVTKIDLSKPLKKLWGKKSLILTSIIVIVSIFTARYINNEFDMLMVYKDYTEVAVNANKVQEVNGGSIPLYIKYTFEDETMTLDNMNEVNSFVSGLNELAEVNKVVNPYRLLDIVYQVNNDGDIPSDMVLNFLYNNVSSDEASPINSLVSKTENSIRLLVFPSNLENDTLKVIEGYAEINNASYTTGVQYLMRDLNVNISSMQITSIFIALGIVLVMMIITLRSLKVAVYSLIPIVITVVSLYGFLGISGIALNITTVIIFSITIGVGIDYAVHYSSVYKYYLNKKYSKSEAVQLAYDNSSRPIIANALGISLGLSIMMFSPLNIHFNVSVLMWVSMIVSVIVTLSLLPTILKGRRDKDA